jgi:hypothetical protein
MAQSPQDEGATRTGRWAFLLVFVLVAGDIGGPPARAQDRPGARRDSLDLISRYRMARFRLLARQFVQQMPLRTLPPTAISTPIDSLFSPTDSTERTVASRDEDPSFPIEDVRRIRDLERSWFRTRYGDTEWSFLGSGPRLTTLDTTRTRELRARLQAHFGDPTFTPAEVDLDEWARRPDSTREGIVQFAYWFVVNDSIPVRVTDANGPTARGLIVSTDRAYRDRLRALRGALLDPLRREERAPYVDYYYEDETRRWYRVGFDGESFFREQISRRDIVRGRRPRLETVQTTPSPPDPTDSPGPSLFH